MSHPVPSLAHLVKLCHHRWVIPLVAAIEKGKRFPVLCSHLNTNRQSLKRALAATEALGLTMLNPGYGHPLRPEYILTSYGERISFESSKVVRAAEDAGFTELLSKKWSLPVLAAVWMGAVRYSEIEAFLCTASPKAIARALEELTDAGCIHRTVLNDWPPRPVYKVGFEYRRLAQCGVALADAASVIS